MTTPIVEALVAGRVVLDQIVAARAAWSAVVTTGDVLTIVDLAGNQAVDCLLYAAADTTVRYSASETIARQGRIVLTTLAATNVFFALPVEEKMRSYIGLSRCHRGYVPVGEEGIESAATTCPT